MLNEKGKWAETMSELTAGEIMRLKNGSKNLNCIRLFWFSLGAIAMGLNWMFWVMK